MSQEPGEIIVHIASVPDEQDDDLPFLIVHFVDHTVISDSEPPKGRMLKPFTPFKRELFQSSQRISDSPPKMEVHFVQEAGSLGMEKNTIRQPTSSKGIRSCGFSFASLLRSTSIL